MKICYLGLLFVFFCSPAFCQGLFSQEGATELTPTEFFIKMKEIPGAVVIDARLANKFKQSRIPGAILAEKSDTLYQILDTLDYQQTLLFYCMDGQRSESAAKLALKEGFQNVFNLKGGFIRWIELNMPVEK